MKGRTYFYARFLFLLSLLSSWQGLVSQDGANAKHTHIFWQIGEFDDNNLEFALSPNHFSQYERPGFHVVGVTDPSLNWPYILPGKLDAWAGPYPQCFEIVFYLDKLGKGSFYRLVLDFLETHSFKPPHLSIEINQNRYEFQTAAGFNDWRMSAENGSGKEQVLNVDIPSSQIQVGENRICITAGEGSWALWDALAFYAPNGTRAGDPKMQTTIRSVKQRQVLIRKRDTLYKAVDVEILHLGAEKKVWLEVPGSEPMGFSLESGLQKQVLWLPESTDTTGVEIVIRDEDEVLTRTTFVLKPVRRWELHLIHQTHLDIGFTHTQEEVLELQKGYLYKALDLIDSTRGFPEEAQFRWHPEGMWAIDDFLENASVVDSLRFVRALKEERIHLDALYVHLLTGLAGDEELLELMRPAKAFEKKYGITVNTAIGSDVPGYSWGLVKAMSMQGIDFFNMAPNNNYKLGHLYHWADKPFYWLGPDGYSKVLTWMASHAYIYFWSQDVGLQRATRFLNYLEDRKFPYDIAMLRYEIGGDNGHPDPTIADQVKAWNEKYAFPRIILSTNSRLYSDFAERFEDQIPVFEGDLTPYWEDGAASTAADLALNRKARETLLQARALEAMAIPGLHDMKAVESAWKNVLMYDEHTWGAYCSKSDPYAPFTISQEKYKQRFAIEADKQSGKLVDQVLGEIESSGSCFIDVINTASWNRSEMVILSAEQSSCGDRVLDELGGLVVSQRLRGGELAFMAGNVPGFGSRRYQIIGGQAAVSQGLTVSQEAMSNEFVNIKINKERGTLESVRTVGSNRELVDGRTYQLNEFLYVQGRATGKGSRGIEKVINISVEEQGPLLGILKIESEAPGCNTLVTKLKLVAGQPGIEIVNSLVKQKNLEPEGVYFAFPWNIPGGIVRMDIPWGVVQPEKDQLPGANRNYFSVQRWLDISNEDYGITWVTADAPILKFAPLTLVGRGRGDSEYMAEFDREGVRAWWKDNINPGQSFFSWVMNNHWEVNYKAFQEGAAEFRYLMIPHEGTYKASWSERRGRSYCQPMIVVETDEFAEQIALPFRISGDQLLVTTLYSEDHGVYILRIYNPEPVSGNLEIYSTGDAPLQIWFSDPSGEPIEPAGHHIELSGYGAASLRIKVL